MKLWMIVWLFVVENILRKVIFSSQKAYSFGKIETEDSATKKGAIRL